MKTLIDIPDHLMAAAQLATGATKKDTVVAALEQLVAASTNPLAALHLAGVVTTLPTGAQRMPVPVEADWSADDVRAEDRQR